MIRLADIIAKRAVRGQLCRSQSLTSSKSNFVSKIVTMLRGMGLTKHPLPMFPRVFHVHDTKQSRKEDHKAKNIPCGLDVQFTAITIPKKNRSR